MGVSKGEDGGEEIRRIYNNCSGDVSEGDREKGWYVTGDSWSWLKIGTNRSWIREKELDTVGIFLLRKL